MPRYVAFLRGINLGNRRVKMDDLRDHFGELDVENVITGREVLWFRRGRQTDSEIETRDLEKAFGGAGGTRRKLNTVRRIVAKFAV